MRLRDFLGFRLVWEVGSSFPAPAEASIGQVVMVFIPMRVYSYLSVATVSAGLMAVVFWPPSQLVLLVAVGAFWPHPRVGQPDLGTEGSATVRKKGAGHTEYEKRTPLPGIPKAL